MFSSGWGWQADDDVLVNQFIYLSLCFTSNEKKQRFQ